MFFSTSSPKRHRNQLFTKKYIQSKYIFMYTGSNFLRKRRNAAEILSGTHLISSTFEKTFKMLYLGVWFCVVAG